MSFNVEELMGMAADLLDLTPDGWERTIWFDMSKLAEETGEVAETLNKSSKTLEDTGEELSDVIFVCGVIATKLGIDLNKASKEKQPKHIQKVLNRFHEGKVPEGMVFRVPV